MEKGCLHEPSYRQIRSSPAVPWAIGLCEQEQRARRPCSALHGAIRTCYTPPVQAAGDEVPVVEVRLNLDGSLRKNPRWFVEILTP
jgi:hypothetical protein